MPSQPIVTSETITNKIEIDAIVYNTNSSNDHYTITEVDDIDNELSTLILDTYTKAEVDTMVFLRLIHKSFQTYHLLIMSLNHHI